ncbi:MAG: hypothetical protein HDQ98_16125 [Lachnospiraceae bacterium]|nr:hypothetical protein [Lachnospiraceae bacterium]MBD5533698.1 hypothetical protein [Lachnospiraceae bacterium]
MILDMDSIQFESRREISNIINALGELLTWENRDKHDENMIDDMRTLRNYLEIMEMNW